MPFRRESFWLPGDYATVGQDEVMLGAAYVERLVPEARRHPLPVVMIHGAGLTAACWIATADGRPGWAAELAGEGYEVYLLEQPARGRSAYVPGRNGALRQFSAAEVERRFTACAGFGDWPQAGRHTQWPGSGRRGDPTFDGFFASLVPFLADEVETQTLGQRAGAALLERIGPALLLTHSQGAALGWLVADEAPGLVRGIVAVEPTGPPMRRERVWGPTAIPIAYDPPARHPDELAGAIEDRPAGQGLDPCWAWSGSPRRLTGLTGVPVLVVISESSYHSVYDHCTAAFLTSCGIAVEVLDLGSEGIHGNGHLMMLERNSSEIRGLISAWLSGIDHDALARAPLQDHDGR